MNAHFALTFYWWWLGAYLAVGVLLHFPMEVYGHSQISPPRPPFWREYLRALRRRPWLLPLQIAAWPLALWELFS